MDPRLLRYPLKSHRKTISLPPESVDLAEFMGIEFGDGGINNPWQLNITLNSEADLEYSKYVISLLEALFNIRVFSRIRPNGKRLVIICSSVSLLEFLVKKGAVRGNKVKQQIVSPAWIHANPGYERAFVRGLMDTDGCLYLHKHTINGKLYKNLGLCFTSFSRPLTVSVAEIFQKNGITPHITQKGTRIYLYSSRSVVQYLNVFGSSNPRILKIYTEWRGRIVA